MTFPSFRLALVAGLVLPFSLAAAALAQDDAPQAAPPAAGADGMHHHWDPAAMRAHMADRLRTVLQLQPAQDAALNAYLDALKPPGDHEPAMHGERQAMDHLPTPERLDRMMARFDERRTHMVARVAATKQFYAQLTPGQQKAFDDIAPRMMMHGMGGRGMDGHGMGGHGGWAGDHHDAGMHPMGPGGAPQG